MNNEYAKIQTPDGATPLTIADAVIRECDEKETIEDVIYYLKCYVKREFGGEE